MFTFCISLNKRNKSIKLRVEVKGVEDRVRECISH